MQMLTLDTEKESLYKGVDACDLVKLTFIIVILQVYCYACIFLKFLGFHYHARIGGGSFLAQFQNICHE